MGVMGVSEQGIYKNDFISIQWKTAFVLDPLICLSSLVLSQAEEMSYMCGKSVDWKFIFDFLSLHLAILV